MIMFVLSSVGSDVAPVPATTSLAPFLTVNTIFLKVPAVQPKFCFGLANRRTVCLETTSDFVCKVPVLAHGPRASEEEDLCASVTGCPSGPGQGPCRLPRG